MPLVVFAKTKHISQRGKAHLDPVTFPGTAVLPRSIGQGDSECFYGSIFGQCQMIDGELDSLVPGNTGQPYPKNSTNDAVQEKPAGDQGAQQCQRHPSSGRSRACGTML